MVLQRWQSLYLLLAAICMAVYAFLPVAEITYNFNTFTLNMMGGITGFENMGYMWSFFTISLLISVFTLITIFKFKNLKLQKNLCLISGCLTLVLLVSLMIVTMMLDCSAFKITFYNVLPVVTIVLFYMADGAITKDQKILSSYDRIR